MINILHLSDIHFKSTDNADRYFVPLRTDLKNELNITTLDYLVISGDIGDYAVKEEYDAAYELTKGLIDKFKLTRDNIIIAPGNHDLNWDASKDSYAKFVFKEDMDKKIDRDERYIELENGVVVRDEELYKKRFHNFSEHFIKRVFDKEYPSEYPDQGILKENHRDKILFLALNSCTEIDHHESNRNNSGINIGTLSSKLGQLHNGTYEDWIKIAVFHHPVFGGEGMKNTDFLEQLSTNGFQICMHGHIHKAQKNLYNYDKDRDIHIIGAGTFGSKAKGQVAGVPLQYNLLRVNTNNHSIIVESRKKDNPDGAWSADPRWGDKNAPEPRYSINLKPVTGGGEYGGESQKAGRGRSGEINNKKVITEDYISWDYIDEAYKELEPCIKEYDPDVIIGLADGRIIGAIIAANCGIDDFYSIDIHKSGRQKDKVLGTIGDLKNKKVLLVDNHIYTGSNWKIANDEISNKGAAQIRGLVLFKHSISVHLHVDYFAFILSGDNRKKMPWAYSKAHSRRYVIA